MRGMKIIPKNVGFFWPLDMVDGEDFYWGWLSRIFKSYIMVLCLYMCVCVYVCVCARMHVHVCVHHKPVHGLSWDMVWTPCHCKLTHILTYYFRTTNMMATKTSKMKEIANADEILYSKRSLVKGNFYYNYFPWNIKQNDGHTICIFSFLTSWIIDMNCHWCIMQDDKLQI